MPGTENGFVPQEVVASKELLPRVDTVTNAYEDQFGKWMTKHALIDYYDLPPKRVDVLVQEARQIQGVDSNSHYRTLYSASDIEAQIQDYLELPKVDKKTGRFIDEKGNVFVAIQRIANELKVDRGTIVSRIKDIEPLKARSAGGEVQIFSEEIIKERLKSYLQTKVPKEKENLDSLPHVDKNGIYVDPNGKEWISQRGLIPEINNPELYSVKLVKSILLNQDSIPGVENGHKTNLYSKKEAIEAIDIFLSLPKVDTKGVYVDPGNIEWVSRAYLFSKEGIDYNSSKELSSKVRTVEARNSNNNKITLYNKEEMLALRSDFIKLPRAKPDGFFC